MQIKFWTFPKKDDLNSWCISEITDSENVVNQISKKSQNVKGNKHCWNLNHPTFTIFIDPCEDNWVKKNLS